MLKSTFFICFFMALGIGFSQQTIISGNVLDTNQNPLDFSSVVLSKNLFTIAYCYTKQDGSFELKTKILKGVYTLKIRRMGYKPIQKKLVFASDSNQNLNISVKLTPTIKALKEVLVEEQSPIIIKNDTIIYDLPHWREDHDQSLEEVLKKIPGFKISDNGDIVVNGKLIRKVLINGKDVGNVGSGVITKSIQPELVKSIEVRLDEKNDKIKESILDNNDYAVLDIKLKSDVKTHFFGKLKFKTGYGKKLELGGYGNVFSLNKKVNLHVFGERDNFERTTIRLSHFRNIGAEALASILSLPADFKKLQERSSWFNDFFYGFKNYTTYNDNIAGLTATSQLSENIKLYIGSYNVYKSLTQLEQQRQSFQSFNQLFQRQQTPTNISSKNKIELRYNNGKFNIKTDFNYLYDDNKKQINITQNDKQYDQNQTSPSHSIFQNINAEYKISDKWGIMIKGGGSSVFSKENTDFSFRDTTHFFARQLTSNTFHQNIRQKLLQKSLSASLIYQSKIGNFSIGYLSQNRTLNVQSQSDAIEFEQSPTSYHFAQDKFLFGQSHHLGPLYFKQTFSLTTSIYSTPTFQTKKHQQFEYNGSASINFDQYDYLKLSYNKSLSSFPLYKLIQTKKFINFQTIETSANTIRPVLEELVSFTASKEIGSLSTGLQITRGTSFNLNQMKQNNAFIISELSQLKSRYTIYGLDVEKKMKRDQISITLGSIIIQNTNDNIFQNQRHKVQTNRYVVSFTSQTHFKRKPLNGAINIQYTDIRFQNKLYNRTSSQKMMSLSGEISYKIDTLNLRLSIDGRYVSFLDNSNYWNTNLKLSQFKKTFNWFIDFGNITNQNIFNKQAIQPLYFSKNINYVFERFIKIGVEYKFK